MTHRNAVLDQLEKASNEFDRWSESKKQSLGSAIGYYANGNQNSAVNKSAQQQRSTKKLK